MYRNPDFNENGEKILCEEKIYPGETVSSDGNASTDGETASDGRDSDMRMDVRIRKLAAGESMRLCAPEKETAVMLLAGRVTFAFENRVEAAARRSVFLDRPYCLHCCRGREIKITAQEDARLLIQQTTNPRVFDTVFYTPDSCVLQEFGRDQWDGTAHRQVLTVFDYDNAPYSNMVLGEVFHRPGCWSSYPPHYHPQPELYYYEFDKPQGFGVGFVGDECFKVENQGCLAITPMKAHQQAAAPGYRMYYAWLIRHLEGDPWRKTRIEVPEHAWLLDCEKTE